jgi:hypothetical protein
MREKSRFWKCSTRSKAVLLAASTLAFGPLAHGGTPPPNDDFANAAVIEGASGSALTYNTNATTEPGEPQHGGQTFSRSLWWTWTAPATGWADFSTYGSGSPLLMAIYTGSTLETLSSVAVNAVSSSYPGSARTDALNVPVVAGQTYHIAVAVPQFHFGIWGSAPDRIVFGVNQAPTILSDSLVRGVEGSGLGYQINATNGPQQYAAEGLPPGMTINRLTGAIGGTPSAPGTYDAQLSATAPGGVATATVRFEIAAEAEPLQPPDFTSGDANITGYIGGSIYETFFADNYMASFSATPLPPGLTATLSSTGSYIVISGNPSQAGTFKTTLHATNAAGSRDAITTFQILAKPPLPIISSAAVASGTIGKSFSYSLTDQYVPNYDPNPVYTVENLPAGLAFNGTTISGTPMSAGTFKVPVHATNSAGTTDALLTLVVAAADDTPPSPDGPPLIASNAGAVGAMGSAFSYSISASNSPASYSATGLPPGVVIDPVTGRLSGTPTQAGSFTASISATNTLGTTTSSLTLAIQPPKPPVFTSAASAAGTVGMSFSYRLEANDPEFTYPTGYPYTSAVTFQVGTLPAGLTFNTSSNSSYSSISYGTITGRPTEAGSYRVPVSATAHGVTTNATLTLVIAAQPALPPVITTASAAFGMIGSTFSQTLAATNLPTSFSVSDLPPGLSFNASTNLISGTPTQAGTFVTTVSATNTVGTGSAKLTYTFRAAPPLSQSTSTKAAYEGTVGQSLSDYIYFSNVGPGTATVSATGLPAGLSIAQGYSGSNYATISGTPTEAGTFHVTIQVASANGTAQTSQTLVIRPVIDRPTLMGDLSADGYVGQNFFNYYIDANSGGGTVTYTASPLPPGLTLSGYQISGIPTKAGTYEIPVSVTNSAGTSSGIVVIRIAALPPAPTLNIAASTIGYLNRAFSYGISAGNTVTSWSLSGTLPQGVSFDASSHQFTGTPTQTGSFPLRVTATGPGGSATSPITLVISATQPPPVITSPIAAFWYPYGSSYYYFLSASASPTSYSAQGVPAGVTFNGSTLSGTIYGGTQKAYPVTISATNTAGTATATVSLLNFPGSSSGIFGPAMALGALNTPFTYRFYSFNYQTASGSYSAVGLPAGLSMNSSTGVISGTPTETGQFPVKITMTGVLSSYPVAATLTLIVQSTPPSPIITSYSGQPGAVSIPFSSTLVAAYAASFSVDSLPPGLSLDAITGKITGTPTAGGRYAVRATATNTAGSNTCDLIFDIAAAPPVPTFSSDAAARGYLGTSFNYYASASSQPTRYEADGLPAGLIISATSGTISGYPTQAGHYEVTLRAINTGGTGTAKLNIDITLPDSPVISSYNYVEEIAGISISYTIGASDSPSSYSATNLPPGLTVNPSNGSISGAATSPGDYLVQVSATNAGGTGTANVLFHILSGKAAWLSSAAGAAGLVGSPFSLSLSNSEYEGTYTAEDLPPGLALTGSQISGTPSTAGDYLATVHVHDGDIETASTVSFHIDATPSLPPIVTSSLTRAVSVGTDVNYQVTATGAPSQISVTSLPAGFAYNPSRWTFSGFPDAAGTYTAEISATNAAGSSTAQVTFLAVAPDPALFTAGANAFARAGQSVFYPISLAQNGPNYYSSQSWPSTPGPTFAVRGLPPGLYFDSQMQRILGTATLAGDYPVELITADAFGNLTTIRVTFHISDANVSAPPLQISTGTHLTVAGTAGSPFTTDVWPIGTVTDIAVTGLPPGLSVTPTGGTSNGFATKFAKVTGTPTTPGSYPVEFVFTDGSISVSASVTIVIPEHATTPGITSSMVAHGTVGRSFSYYMYDSYASYFQNAAATGAVSNLPDGLTFDLGRRMITGTPSTAGRFAVPVILTNSGGDTEATLTFDIEDSAPGLPRLSGFGGIEGMPIEGGLAAQTTAYAGQAFQFTLSAENDVTDLTISGLPDGLRLRKSGSSWVLEGEPLTSGTFPLVVLATNDSGVTTLPLTLSVRGLDQVTNAPTPDPTPTPTPVATPTPEPATPITTSATPDVVLDKPRRIQTSEDHLVIRGHIPDYPPGTRVFVLVDGKWKKVRLTANGSFKLRLTDIPTGRSKISVRVTNSSGKKKTIHLQIVRSRV